MRRDIKWLLQLGWLAFALRGWVDLAAGKFDPSDYHALIVTVATALWIQWTVADICRALRKEE